MGKRSPEVSIPATSEKLMRENEIPKEIRARFRRGKKVIQEYTFDPKKCKKEPTDPCGNCSKSHKIRYFEKLGNVCLFCFANARQCSVKGCRKWTVLDEKKHDGKCRDCFIGKEATDYKAAAYEKRGESALCRSIGDKDKIIDGSGRLLQLLRRKMREKGIYTESFRKMDCWY
ncbi:hypothetical protein KAR91_04635 [Candidatus Pacearchaeota archaeon]|nr:hypothetical protein [Candidatus Pacearchaeota archaeon]